ncbi:MAG: hypothetical protein JW874_06990, partial [Spirochaetales bacterium]|nr:hypothetical protein [Spirochaetales bacterium]
MSKFVTMGLTLLLLFACSSTKGTEKTSQNTDVQDTSASVSESGVLEGLRTDIVTALPASLMNVYSAVQQGSLAGSEKAEEYKFIAWKLMMLLYPEKAAAIEVVLPPAYSNFPHIFSELEKGRIVSIEPENTSYLTLLLSTLVLLYTEDKATISNALENLREANSLNPLSPSVLPSYISGRYQEKTGDTKQAAKEYEQTLFISELMYPARFGLYRIYIKEGKIETAKGLEAKLAEDLSQNAEYLYFYAIRLIESGEIQKSFDQTEKLVKKYPDNREYQLLRARQYVRLDRPQQALPILEALSKQRYAKPAEYYLAYCRTLRLLEKNATALAIIKEGMDRYPDNSDLKIEYGKILIVTGDV